MNNYTQGDWKIRFYKSNVVGVNVCFAITGERGSTICGGQSQEHLGEGFILEDECRANAHLLRASKDLFEALRDRIKNDEQSAFEDWLRITCPSGDVESVQRQWEESSLYYDFLDDTAKARAAITKALGEVEQAGQITEAA